MSSIAPQRRVYRIGNDTLGVPMLGNILEKPSLTQKPRESPRVIFSPIGFKSDNGLTQVIGDPDLPIIHGSKACDRVRSVCDLDRVGWFFPIMPDRPDLAGRVITIDVSPCEPFVLRIRAPVDDSACKRTGLAVMMILDRWLKRLLTAMSIGVEDRCALHDTPAIVCALFYQVHLFPDVLAVLPKPDATRDAIGRDPPGVSQSVGPRFGANIRSI